MLIDENLIMLDVDYKTKEEVIQKNAELLNDLGRLNDMQGYIDAVIERENELCTNLGDGIGMPHARTSAVKEVSLIFLRLKEPIAWGEEGSVKIVFQIAVGDEQGDLHLKLLSQLARKLIYDEIKEKLFNVKDKQEVLSLISDAVGGLK